MSQRRLEIKKAFEVIKDEENGVKYERVTRFLLKRLYPNINPLPSHRDLGQDATASPLTPVRMDDRNYTFLASLKSDWAKLKTDCDQCRAQNHKIDVIVFSTWQATGEKQKTWKDKVKQDYGWELIVHELQFFIDETLLDENAYFAAQELNLPLAPHRLPSLTAQHPVGPVADKQVLDGLVQDRIQLGIDQRKAWKLKESLLTFQTALDQCSHLLSTEDQARINTNLGAVYRDQGNVIKAEEHFQRANELDPDNIDTHVNLAVCAIDRSDLTTAKDIIDAVPKHHRPNAQGLSIDAYIMYELGCHAEALDQSLAAVKTDPDCTQAHLTRAMILRRQDCLEESADELKKTIALDPRHYLAIAISLETEAHLISQGKARLSADDIIVEASSVLREIDRLSISPPQALRSAIAGLHTALGLALLLRGQWKEAENEFKMSLNDVDDPATHQNLGMAYLQQGRNEEFYGELRRAMELGSLDPVVLYNVATQNLIRFQTAKDLTLLEESERYLAILKRERPEEPWTVFLEGLVLCGRSQYKGEDIGIGRAKALFRQVVEDNDCPQDLSMNAHVNLQIAERLEEDISNWRRSQSHRSL